MTVAPPLPAPRGPLSESLLAALEGECWPARAWEPELADPLGEDFQLALYIAYELHYRGFSGVLDETEWSPEILARRRDLELLFLASLRLATEGAEETLDDVLAGLLKADAGAGVSAFLARGGTREQVREMLVHRSAYHLKEADPQAFAVPRLDGRAKAGMAAVLFDEYGGGSGARMHAQLFADLMREFDLDPTYGRYLDVIPAPMLAAVNFMSLCGLHRGLRGALIGQLALVEITSPPGSVRMLSAVRRHNVSPAAEAFYAEHIVADSVHEQVMRRDVLGGLLEAEPALERDVLFGIAAATWLDDRLDAHLLGAWKAGRSSLRADAALAGASA